MATDAPAKTWSEKVKDLPQQAYTAWVRAQQRLSSMVLTEVPLILFGVVTVLTVLGLVMVLSASSIDQISKGVSPWGQARTQMMFAFMGLVAMLTVGYAFPVTWYRKRSVLNLLLLGCIGLLMAVVFFGDTVNGNRNWIAIGPFTMQPSEFAKPVMILWLARVFANQGALDTGTFWRSAYKTFVPALLGFSLIVGLILLGHDVGTVVVYGLFFFALFMAAKPNSKVALATTGILLLLAAYALLGSENRRVRFLNVLPFGPPCIDASCDQTNASLAALATGGFWGVGLGQSRQKYKYLPEAHNDFIFAIVGEELGLVGALAVLLLYGMLIYCSMRIILRSSDIFIKYATLGIITWFAGQGIMNIGMAVGVVPVIGVPLPFVSYGGSSMISSMLTVGLLIAFARQTPLQPIMGENAGTVEPARSLRLAKRRFALAEAVRKEQATLAQNPLKAGYTWEKLVLRWNLLVGGGNGAQPQRAPRSAQHQVGERTRLVRPTTAAAGRPSATTVRRAQQPASADSMEAAVARRGSSSSGARPSASVQQAQQAYQRKQQAPQGRRHAPQGGSSQPTPAQLSKTKPVAPRQTAPVEKPAPAPERKLPAGLRTIRHARPLPGDSERES